MSNWTKNSQIMERELDNLLHEISQGPATANAHSGFGPTSRPTGTTTARSYVAVDRQTTKSRRSNEMSSAIEMTPIERFANETFKDGPWHAIAGVTNSASGSAVTFFSQVKSAKL
ncbi:hypothetical protein B0T20DRAFT_500154 [Sordaria brevicollis]|uniref:Uncharacterized protein n=1 Tax=Sordaria brevicollis TaxID=83679 RepID=A0AAE0UAN6_SORBR|nr:hypothetical protein B0T20DRAFT_500154 [Sordaria brevicollis]